MSKKWEKIKLIKQDQPLVYIHTPKCGGTYVRSVLKDLNIRNKGHNKAKKNEGICFTVIRDPVERFESFLNFRLGENKPRKDWPIQLLHVYNHMEITLDAIVSGMSDNDIVQFKPYRSLIYWSENIDIFITIDKLQDFLKYFGYVYNANKYPKMNVSNKVRGVLSENTKRRIEALYYQDLILFNKWSGLSCQNK